jgi:formate--tetrahydrofolate ligase
MAQTSRPRMRSVRELEHDLGLAPDEILPVSAWAGKVPVSVVRGRAARGRRGRLVLITGMTPTKHGEGKTVTAIGLANGFARIGRRAVVCLRQPSLGPVFGVKGGATGGGRVTVEPADEINLGFTGDIYAIASAHNLLSALIDNHLYHGNSLAIDPGKIVWPRTVDMEDRALRHIVVGRGADPKSISHESSFQITASSEVMVILALARDYSDLKSRLGRILVAYTREGRPIRASDLRAQGAMAALLRDALQPNLVQTSEGVPALIHTGPFGNLAHGTCSLLAIELGLATAEFAVVEAGFATELGGEKFIDIVTPALGSDVDAAVLVVTQRGLREQGGVSDEQSLGAHPEELQVGLQNLGQHLDNLAAMGLPTVVALNRFPGDTPGEADRIRTFCEPRGVEVVESRGFEEGGSGCEDLARAVERLTAEGRHSRPLSPVGTPLLDQIDRIARTLYGAAAVVASSEASEDLKHLEAIGETQGPVCMAKTPLSLSDNPHLKNRPSGFTVTVHRLVRSAGAGFTVAYLGTIETMPGLPTTPAAEQIDLTPEGQIVGLR